MRRSSISRDDGIRNKGVYVIAILNKGMNADLNEDFVNNI